MKAMNRAWGTAGAIALIATILSAAPARANFHLIKISEIFAGTAAQPEAQFVELRMYSGGQNQLATHSLVVYDETGLETARFTFTSAVPNGDDQAAVLLATPEAETLFGVKADLAMTTSIVAAGGKVCWEPGLVDCASWGSYSGGAADQGANATGTPFNQPTGLVPGQSMERKIAGGMDPNKLDAGDDTNDSAADFQLASPTPQPNAASAATTHERSISLKLKDGLDASGKVTVEDDFDECSANVPVALQRKRGGGWKTVDKTQTNGSGAYETHVADKPGTYRAKATSVSAGDADDCLAATSRKVRH